MQKKIKILVVDDEAIVRESLRDWLTDVGYRVWTAGNCDEALELVRLEKPDVAILDLVIPGSNGLEIFKQARQILPGLQVIIITAYGSVPTAISAMKDGAYDYIEKPFAPEKIEQLISDMLEKQAIVEGYLPISKPIDEKYIFENIVAKSSRMQKIIEMIKVVAKSNAQVLIFGESGTGKELVARAIHSQSFRNHKPFVTVSCSHLSDVLIDSELFGHETGVFNNVNSQRRGKFETANEGTLFLDEVGGLDPNVQVHLLRVLEEKAFYRIGGSEPVKTEVRIISATNKDMKKAIEAGQFREDLFYRLSVVNIELPPLRERKEDIPVLADFFLRKFTEENQKKVSGLSPEASEYLLKYEWPGNIRELENSIERAVILAKGPLIEVADLSKQSLFLSHKITGGKSMREIEKNHIYNIIIEAGGNCSKAARLLGISRMTLYNKIKAYGLNINNINIED
jgi:two-component system, NtrC family, response regulator AtoC